jgi:hypothetical protein
MPLSLLRKAPSLSWITLAPAYIERKFHQHKKQAGVKKVICVLLFSKFKIKLKNNQTLTNNKKNVEMRVNN